MTTESKHVPAVRITRRRLLETSARALGLSGLALLGAGCVGTEGKVSKDLVNYQDAPRDGQRCSGCRFFIEGGRCEKVAGEISPDGWCSLFAPQPA